METRRVRARVETTSRARRARLRQFLSAVSPSDKKVHARIHSPPCDDRPVSPPLTLDQLIEFGDLTELFREIDRLVAQRNWRGLLTLRDRARAAHERGKQLWPAAAHAEYRLALEAPAEFAGAVIAEGAGRFAAGPLAEVAASTHTWLELAPHIETGPLLSITAHERVVRGDDL
ncbi:MAG: hypothetical protein QOG30_3075, partial [Acidimicrobiaceae bacterium]